MPTVTVPRTDLSTEEMVTVLRDGLGAGYNVLPGMTMGQLPFQGPREGRPRGAGEQAAPKASRADQAPLPSGWADGDGMTSRASSARWRDWPM